MARYLALLTAYLLQAALPLVLPVARNFEYEYVLLSGYAALILLPLVGLILPLRLLPNEDGRYTPSVSFDFFWTLVLSPLIGVAAIAALYWWSRCLCSGPGLAFWLAFIWYPAWVLAHALMYGILSLRSRGFSRLAVFGAWVLGYLLLTVEASATLWYGPPKRLQHLLTGFWHGPIYDAFIAVDPGMVLKQVAFLLAAIFLLEAALMKRSFISALCQGVTLALLGLVGYQAASYPSTQNTKAALDQVLNATLSGPGYVLHYQKMDGEGDADYVNSAKRLARDAEFHIGELTKALGLSAAEVPLVQIYLYTDDDSKKLFFGGGSTDVTDVRTPAIHITSERWPHPTLRHELVHAIASRIAFRGLGFHPNLALTEGLAVALAPAPRQVTLDDGAAALLESERLPSVEALFSPYFWTLSGDRAYTVAGSLIDFIAKNRGIDVVKSLYAGNDFETALGAAKEEVLSTWKKQIKDHFDKSTYAMYSEALYRSPGILHSLCPHSKADLLRSRDQSVYVRMRQPLGWDPDGDYGPWLSKLNPQDLEPRVRGWRREAMLLATERVPKLTAIKDLRDRIAASRKRPSETLEDIEIGVLEADLAAILGDRPGSIKILQDLQSESQKKFLGDSLTREIHARRKIEETQQVTTPLEWRRYLAGWRKAIPSGGEGEPWILTYLKVKSPRGGEITTEKLRHYLVNSAPDSSLPATFTQEWYRVLAEKLMTKGAYAEAKVAYEKASQVARPAMRPLLEEHARRAAFYGVQPAS
ncbi:MAG: hypothetical protein RL011_1379 [Pseudomonadota bacterium]